MRKKYIRNIGIEALVKNIHYNIGKILILLVPLMLLVIGGLFIVHKNMVSRYTTSGSIRINNFYPLTYPALPSLEAANNSGTSLSGLASNSETITSLITTSYILNSVIEKNHLDIGITPKEDFRIKQFLANPFIPVPKIIYPQISIFEVGQGLYNKELVLVFTGTSGFNLYLGHIKLGSGKVGLLFQKPQLSLLIDKYGGRPGTAFLLKKKSLDAVISELTRKLNIGPVIIYKKNGTK